MRLVPTAFDVVKVEPKPGVEIPGNGDWHVLDLRDEFNVTCADPYSVRVKSRRNGASYNLRRQDWEFQVQENS